VSGVSDRTHTPLTQFNPSGQRWSDLKAETKTTLISFYTSFHSSIFNSHGLPVLL